MIAQISDTQWDDFVASREEANFLQSSAWGKANERVGHTVVRDGIQQSGILTAGWQGIVKNAKRGRYLEVPGGPLLDWGNSDDARTVIQQLKQVGKRHNCAFVRIRPQVIESTKFNDVLSAYGLKKAPFHLHAEHTNILDLTQPEEDLLKNMRRQTRYEVRRSAKQNISVSWRSDDTAVDEFFAVQADTAQRQGFIPPSRDMLAAQIAAFGDNARIYRAEVDGILLNLALVLFSGEEADYFEAASTPESRKFAGAYGLQWQAIKDAKLLGKTRYNFWGIAYSNDPNHRYAGVTTFKRGFGGEDVTYTAAHDLPLSPRYAVIWLIETIRRKRRKL